MNIEPLTRAVVRPEFVELLRTPQDALVLPPMASYTFVASVSELVPNILSNLLSPTASTRANPEAVSIVTKPLQAISLSNIMRIDHLLAAHKTAGLNLFYRQLGRVFGNTGNTTTVEGNPVPVPTLSPAQLAAISRYVNLAADAMEGAMPLNTSTAADVQEFHLQAVEVMIRSLTENVKDSNIYEMLFPVPVLIMLYIGFMPWLIMRYFATFVSGPWNHTQRPNLSFYDSRYAEFIIYSSVSSSLMELVRMNTDTSVKTDLVARMNAINTAMVSRSETEAGGEALLSMYSQVAGLAQQSKAKSMALAARSASFDDRRQVAMSVAGNQYNGLDQMRKARREFYAWIIAYGVVLVVSVVLLVMAEYDMFLWQAALVATVVAIYLFIKLLRGEDELGNNPRLLRRSPLFG